MTPKFGGCLRFACLLLLVSGPLHAGIYKCTNNGKVSYQSEPCATSGVELKAKVKNADAMLGCYEVSFPGWESGMHHERYKVQRAGNGDYEMVDLKRKDPTGLPMKQATRDERRMLASAIKRELTDGVSMAAKEDAPNQKPVGIYKFKDVDGQEKFFFYFFFSNGIGRKVPCP